MTQTNEEKDWQVEPQISRISHMAAYRRQFLVVLLLLRNLRNLWFVVRIRDCTRFAGMENSKPPITPISQIAG